jgi:mono/diheme cytochrome c family protein
LKALYYGKAFFVTIMITFFLNGCFRGQPSEDPPIHINPNMDDQPKYKAQSESGYFENSATMRQPVDGTVARDELYQDTEYYFGKDANGNLVTENPLEINMQLLKRGQERFNIYCSPCHSRVGDGQGIVVKRGFLPPPSFHQDMMREKPDGHYFDVITHGLRNMPSYRHQIPVKDRWAIVAYIRALQRSQHAGLSDIPADKRKDLK